MTSCIKSVVDFSKKATMFLAGYSKALLLTVERKNYTSMARYSSVSARKLANMRDGSAKYVEFVREKLFALIKEHSSENNRGKLIIDFTAINKMYSQSIENVTYDRDGSISAVRKGFSLGFIAWSNDQITIPFAFDYWLRRKDIEEKLYRKKNKIAQDLIMQYKEKILFDELLCDGAFATYEMLLFLINIELFFTMRMARNRTITTEKNSIPTQLQKHPELRLFRNEKSKTIVGYYKGIKLFITAQKRKGRKGKKEVVFIVSNVPNRTAKEHVKNYSSRSPVEKFFRTSKQKLGIQDCQSVALQNQNIHFYSVMYTYAMLEVLKIDNRKSCPEDIVNILRRQKSTSFFTSYIDQIETFMA